MKLFCWSVASIACGIGPLGSAPMPGSAWCATAAMAAPKAMVRLDRPRAVRLVKRASQLYQMKRFAEAAALCLEAMQADSTYARAWTWQGAAQQKLHRKAAAAQSWRRVLQLAPNSADAARAHRGLIELGFFAANVKAGTSKIGAHKTKTPNPPQVTPSTKRPAMVPPPIRIVMGPSGEPVYDVGANLERMLLGHQGGVRAVAFAPDSNTVASGSVDKTVRLWDAVGNSANKEAKKILSGPHDELTSVAFSPDGRLLAAGSVDNFVQLWSMPDGAARPPLSGDGHDIDSLAFSPDGQVLAGGAGDGTIWLWNLKSGRARFLHGHSRGVISLFFSRDGATLLSASLDSTVRLWDVTRGQTTKTLTLPAPSIAALSPDASLLAITAGNAVQLLDARGGDANSAPLLRTLSGHRSGVTTICFSPDGQTLATGGYDSTVRLWDVAHGKLTSKLKGHGGVARSVAFSPDGLTLATGSDDKTVNLWRMQVP